MEHMEITVHITKTGTVYKDKALIAYDTSTSKVLGIGEECNAWLNQSLVTVTSPLKDGKIASFQASVLMFKMMIKRAYEEAGIKCLSKKRKVAVCVGTEMTEIEQKALEDCFYTFSKDLIVAKVSYQALLDMMAENKERRLPEVIVEIGQTDMTDFVKMSLKKVTDQAQKWGFEKKKILEMCRECLELDHYF